MGVALPLWLLFSAGILLAEAYEHDLPRKVPRASSVLIVTWLLSFPVVLVVLALD